MFCPACFDGRNLLTMSEQLMQQGLLRRLTVASKKTRLKVAFETSHYNPRYHSNCAFAPLRDSIKSFALTRHHGIPYLLARRNRRKFQVISSEGMGPLISPLPVHTTHRLSESLNIGLSSSSLLRFILLNCPHCSAFSSRCQHLFSFFRKKGATKTSSGRTTCFLDERHQMVLTGRDLFAFP